MCVSDKLSSYLDFASCERLPSYERFVAAAVGVDADTSDVSALAGQLCSSHAASATSVRAVLVAKAAAIRDMLP